jgi:hypothetical protein
MPTDSPTLRIAKRVMKERPLHCTRTEEVDKQGGRLQTTSLMWYRPPRSKESSWIQVISTDFEYYRAPSGRKKMISWHVTTLHVEYAETTTATPVVMVHTYRHNSFPTMVFDNYEARIMGRGRLAHWSRKSSKTTDEIRELSSYAQQRRKQGYTRALMSPHEQVRRFNERPHDEKN